MIRPCSPRAFRATACGRCAPHQVILATGAIERPIAFANNDRPGVMLASAARGMVERYGVSPGASGVVFTNNDDAYQTAIVLKDAGVGVRVVDSRSRAEGALPNKAREMGIAVDAGSVISAVNTTWGGLNITDVKVASYRKGQGRVIKETKVACDFVAMSGGWNPALHLWCHNGGKIRFDDELQSFRPDRHHDGITAIGAANGTFAPAADPRRGLCRGLEARQAPATSIPLPAAVQADERPLEPIWFAPATGKYNEGNKHFIDYQNDVTAADLELAQREGYESVEHTKRYTTFGMATDQGKTSNLNGLGVLSEATGKTIPEIGVTTFRPPYTPFSFGSIAGVLTKDLFLPIRRTADLSVACGPGRRLRARRPVAPRLHLSEGRRGQARLDRPRDPRRAQQGGPARCLDAGQDRDQGPGCGRIPRPHVHQHVLDAESGQVPLRADDERAGLPHRRRRHRAPGR